ncbi:hypothetical protein GCM10022243_09150 [Saccharothrix violaceirubra]|uniref:Uncharacterized protein n=1 Tax=Saccharothrix violaceirubra TaxID=413306 RepID=A0A7W7T470_9PSEU|nr:hypothetical protein [Saccharothrix violaceirubra]MBB4966248.1 hypothetical protein [Saccharothrix violaceirubra]
MHPTPPGSPSDPGSTSSEDGRRFPAREPSLHERLLELEQEEEADAAATGHADDDVDLDDLLAGMSGQATTWEEIRRRGRELLVSLSFDVAAEPGPGPRGPSPAPVVPYPTADGRAFATSGPERVGHLTGDALGAGIVGLLIERQDTGTADFAPVVEAVRARFDELAAHDGSAGRHEPHAAVLSALLAARPALVGLRESVEDPELDLPLPQAAAVVRFLAAYPHFQATLTTLVAAIRFDSGTADGFGGGVFSPHGDGCVHVSRLRDTPPGAFVRLFVHETGHAAFEATLLGRREMQPVLGRGQAGHLIAQPSGENFEEADHDPVMWSAELRDLEDFWASTSEEARNLYRAWLVLRVDGGRHLLGQDLWAFGKRRLSADQRRVYQAGKFIEFCAEVFMQYALGDLRPFLVELFADPHVEDGIAVAWRHVWDVLETVAAPLLGARAS